MQNLFGILLGVSNFHQTGKYLSKACVLQQIFVSEYFILYDTKKARKLLDKAILNLNTQKFEKKASCFQNGKVMLPVRKSLKPIF